MPTATEIIALKRHVRERDGMSCTKCGMSNADHVERYGKSLHVHRVVPGSEYAIDGCVTLCFPCHGPEPKSPRGKGKGAQPVQLPAALREACAAYIASQDYPPPLSRVVVRAVQKLLQEAGFWPPKPKPGA